MKAFYRLFYYISIVLTSILAGVTIAGAFVGNAAPDSFKFMPFIGLMLPILLLATGIPARIIRAGSIPCMAESSVC